jgi:hypothetical protein
VALLAFERNGRLTAICETSFNSDFLANTKTGVGSRVAHEPLLLNRDLLHNYNSWSRSKLVEW